MLNLICVLLLSLPGYADSVWQELLQKDLSFIRQTIQENTPNAVDKEHPEFSKWLEAGMQEIGAIDSLDGYFANIEYYVGGFKDPHIDFQPLYSPSNYRWPGFIVKFDGRKWKISYVEPNDSLSIGDEILTVDSIPPTDLMLVRVFPYQNLPSTWRASWQLVAPQLFLDKGNPYLKPLKKITVKNENGIRALALNWTSIAPEKWRSLSTTPKKSWSIESVFNGRASMVSMPYFSVKDKQQQTEIENIISLMPTLRTKDFIILDLRGNPGGQSFWGIKALETLYGDHLPTPASKGLDRWRVSKGNLSALKEKYLPFLKTTTGENSPEYIYVKETIQSMEKTSTDFAESRMQYSDSEKLFKPLFPGKLIVVTDSACASSCLTVLAQIKLLPNVVLVGQDTTGISPYVESRKVELPSKLGFLFFPMKMIPIDESEYFKPFTPDHVYEGDLNDSQSLINWIKLINLTN